MDKKIVRAEVTQQKVVDSFYVDHDISLKQKERLEKDIAHVSNSLLTIDKKYDAKKHQRQREGMGLEKKPKR